MAALTPTSNALVLKNLLRRRIRTLLTVLGIGIGVAAIIALGAMADGLQSGYGAMLTGSKADLILSQPNAYDISFSAVDQALGASLAAMPEVSEVSSMIEGFAATEGQPLVFVFGYPHDSFVLPRFNVIKGASLFTRQAQPARGKPILIGSATAEVLHKKVGDTLRMTGTAFRVVGIYETGDAFEDSGVLLDLPAAQELLGKPRQVSLFYVRLKDPSLSQRFIERIQRQFKDLALSGTKDYASNQSMFDMLRGFIWALGGLAILIGGVGMMNAQLMAVMERTREIGVLRAVGWSSLRVLWMILGEAVLVCLMGGLCGLGLGWLALLGLSKTTIYMGMSTTAIRSGLLLQAFMVVFIMGLVGGLYPAWRASRMQPVEALRYEGGSSGKSVRRLPIGGMAVQSLWQRSTRTFLTLGVISLTVGAILCLETLLQGFAGSFTTMITGADAQVMVRQANVGDTSLSAVDERVGAKIAAMPEVSDVNGVVFTAVNLPEYGSFFIVQGYPPAGFSIKRFKLVEGQMLTTNHQIIIGKLMADMMHRTVGDTMDLSGSRYRIVGIYESQVSWEETGGVLTLRDAQTFTGRPRKVTMYGVKLRDPEQAQVVADRINQQFPGVYAALAGDFVEQLPDMKSMDGMMNGISLIAVLVGGIGVLNAMLMSVFERTREIGVLRALGWRRRAILGMILREALLLGVLGGLVAILAAFGMNFLITRIPMLGSWFEPVWQGEAFVRAILIAIILGSLGGLYPAYRATRLQPVEALRYE